MTLSLAIKVLNKYSSIANRSSSFRPSKETLKAENEESLNNVESSINLFSGMKNR